MAWQNLREDIEGEFEQYLRLDTREQGRGLRNSSAEYMREWRKLNPQLALAARKRWDATRKARRAEFRLTNPRKPGGKPARPFEEISFLRLTREGRTTRQIAQMLGVSQSYVSKRRKALGLGLKNGSNQFKRCA